jgi:Ser/Thr protein kinase RdoA (MazF antagonist)
VSDELLGVARDAVRAYDIEVVDVTFAKQAFNTTFRVEADDGSAYALRVGPALRIHADGCEELETAWLLELNGAGLRVVVPVAARNGAFVVSAGERRGVLFEWLPGRSLREHATRDFVRMAGTALARLHEQPAGDRTDAPAGALAGDRVLSFLAPFRLGELEARVGTPFGAAVERAQSGLDALWRKPPHPPRLLHGDVNLGNVLVDGAGVTLIDFQDLFWGFEIQDVTIATMALPDADAFRAGYETVRPWPEADGETIAALKAARHLNVLNFGLSVGKPGLDEFVARLAGPIAEWMAGELED